MTPWWLDVLIGTLTWLGGCWIVDPIRAALRPVVDPVREAWRALLTWGEIPEV